MKNILFQKLFISITIGEIFVIGILWIILVILLSDLRRKEKLFISFHFKWFNSSEFVFIIIGKCQRIKFLCYSLLTY